MALFENYERRIEQINKALKENGIASIEEAKEICDKAGVDAYNIVKVFSLFVLKMHVGHIQ